MASGEIDVTPGRILGASELVTHQKLNDLAVPTLRIKPLAITARELADGSINSDKLDVDLEAQLGVPDNSVTTNKIVNLAVTAAKLAPDAVTVDKVAPDLQLTSIGDLVLYRPAGLIYINTADSAIAAVADTTIYSYTVPAGLLSRTGDTLRLTTSNYSGASAVLKTLRWKLNSAEITNFGSSSTFGHWHAEIMIMRSGANSQKCAGRIYYSSAALAPTNQTFIFETATSENNALGITVAMSGADASGLQITGNHFALEFLPAP